MYLSAPAALAGAHLWSPAGKEHPAQSAPRGGNRPDPSSARGLGSTRARVGTREELSVSSSGPRDSLSRHLRPLAVLIALSAAVLVGFKCEDRNKIEAISISSDTDAEISST
jgi:hypothetical protein